jgi:hypothetical protein
MRRPTIPKDDNYWVICAVVLVIRGRDSGYRRNPGGARELVGVEGRPPTETNDRAAGIGHRRDEARRGVGMSKEVRKRYRPRYVPTAEDLGILEYYAERYSIARRIGVPRNETAYMIEEARQALSEVSDRNWDREVEREPYEVRQWFNRWMKRLRRTENLERGRAAAMGVQNAQDSS